MFSQIKNLEISKLDAALQVNKLIPELENYFFDRGGVEYTKFDWVFPLKGYDVDDIGGTNGSGYINQDFNFFDENKRGGHPAHEIFIKDINQDYIDDETQKPVDVLSMTSGIVVALEDYWDTNSISRGGKFVIVFDTYIKALFYYAHNNLICVNIGDVVKPGDKIAEVGRTGLNAYKKRSHTHLHISCFQIIDGDLKPRNLYSDLVKAKLIK